MADYNRSEAYDLSLFGAIAVEPVYEPEAVPVPAERPVEAKPRKTSAQVRRESIVSAVRALKIFTVAAVLLTLFGAVLYSRVSLVMLRN